jgi:uroporphyrinogen decarboxylase
MTNAVFEREFLEAIEGDILLIASPRMCNAPLRGPGVRERWKEQELWGRTFRVLVTERFTILDNRSVAWQFVALRA